ncbi:hypothetical protein [Nioella ostreopsis]|uniref:hypothetical protein n=1 Tax=Nioella ostreopsis TaxID=2448479 RepID=UPI000FD7ED31|nr:hypothetical protein [Nioella ostreopsis]
MDRTAGGGPEMNPFREYQLEDGQLCLCCGSRDVLTAEKAIENLDDPEARSALVRAKLLAAIRDLDEYEMDNFIGELMDFAPIEEPDDMAHHLWCRFSETFGLTGFTFKSAADDEPLDLVEIDERFQVELEFERKLALLRIWVSLSKESQRRFVKKHGLSVLGEGC